MNIKSGFPYLCDIKLTNFCSFGCEFCYQSSTKQGKHADSYFVNHVLKDYLFKSNVLEVCFGGGETTLYPNLNYILSSYKSSYFTVGLTTKNYNWHNKKEFAEEIKNLDSVAISCNSKDDLEKAKNLYLTIEASNVKPYIQCILELVNYDKFKEFINYAAELGIRNITLLGYKDFGFGQNQKQFNYPPEWISFIKNISDKNYINFGVDSIISQKWKKELINNGVESYCLVGKEGLSSCYIDAVERKMYSSSFSKESGVEIPENIYKNKDFNFLNEFKKFI